MDRSRIYALFVASLLWSMTAVAVTPDEMREVRRQFSGGLSSEQANEVTHDILQRLLEKEPDNPLLLVYFGSTETLMGGYAWMPWNKLGYVNNGLAHIERALRLAEQEEVPQQSSTLLPRHEVQLVAARTYLALPDMFNTFEGGKRLVAQLLEAEALSQWPNSFRASLFNAAAKMAERDGDNAAQAKWRERAVALATDNKTGAQ